MGSHSVTCHPTEERIPPLPPAEASTWFSDPGGMQGWVDLCYVKADRPGLNPRPVNRKSNALPLSHHTTSMSTEVVVSVGYTVNLSWSPGTLDRYCYAAMDKACWCVVGHAAGTYHARDDNTTSIHRIKWRHSIRRSRYDLHVVRHTIRYGTVD